MENNLTYEVALERFEKRSQNLDSDSKYLLDDEYRLLSKRTVAPSKIICGIPLDSYYDTRAIDLLHGAIGISTEITELFELFATNKIESKPSSDFPKYNLGEEIGDILWYMAIFEREYSISFKYHRFRMALDAMPDAKMTFSNYTEHLIRMNISAGKLLDVLKKKAFYNKNIDEAVVTTLLASISTEIFQFCHLFDLSIDKIRFTNIEKLYIRFKDKFSTTEAIDRDLDAEKVILDKGVE